MTRTLAYLLLAWVALVLIAAFRALTPVGGGGIVPEVCLLLVLHLGLNARGTAPGAVALALLIGYLVDLFSGAPRGVHALSLALVMVTARGLSSRLLVSSLWQQLVVTLLATLAEGALVVALSSQLYDGEALAGLSPLPATALVTAAAAPIVFAFARRIDRRLAPDPTRLRMG